MLLHFNFKTSFIVFFLCSGRMKVYLCFKRVAELGVLPCALFTGEEQKQGGCVSRIERIDPPHPTPQFLPLY